MNAPGVYMESKISPWLRLITPVALTLILFVLNNMNAQFKGLSEQISDARDFVQSNSLAIRENTTSIRLLHRGENTPFKSRGIE